jgi:hypothetical protein
LVAQRNAQLTFVIDDPRTPLAVGWSNDERQLGVHLRSLMLEQVGRRCRVRIGSPCRLARDDAASTAS